MYIKAIIFDLDETLYDYKNADQISYDQVKKYLAKKKACTVTEISPFISKAKELVKKTLSSHTSSHNRILYFQKLVEILNLPYNEADKINKLYWETFYDSISSREGVVELFDYLKEQKIKIAILTNFTTDYQFEKLKKLNLLKYIDVLVTSEEIGVEKPDRRIFQTVINKLNLLPNQLLMVGDDFVSDIEGAIQSKIYAAHFNSEKIAIGSDYLSFTKFDQLLQLLQNLNNALKQLHTLCNRYGQRFDLTQAGGGNISVKIPFGDKTLLIIKASGYSLADVSTTDGYVILNNNNLTEKVLLKTALRPSIETAMHSSLQTYTVHLHAIQAISILVKKDAEKITQKLFPDSLFIDYFTPGKDLANAVLEKYNSEKLIFLKNHGILLTTPCISNIETLLCQIDNTLEQQIPVRFTHYKMVNLLSDRLEGIFNQKFISYLIEDKVILDLFKDQKIDDQISTPDKLVYCGTHIVTDLETLPSLSHAPSLIFYNDHLFSVAHSLKKCREIAEVFKAHLLFSSKDDQLLEGKEISFLQGWDAEKYRKRV